MRLTLPSIFLFFVLLSCSNNDLEQALESLEGTWQIERIIENSGTRVELGISIDSTIEENGDLGQFHFDPLNVQYDFITNLDLISGSSPYELIKASVHCGFTNCTQYTLELDDINYVVHFGDQTSDAHENATNIQLTTETQTLGPYKGYNIFLIKN